jgi:hypothetical protein
MRLPFLTLKISEYSGSTNKPSQQTLRHKFTNKLHHLSSALRPEKILNQPANVAFVEAKTLSAARYLKELYVHRNNDAAAPTVDRPTALDF